MGARRRRTWAVVTSVSIALIALALLAPTWIGSWAPVLHVSCSRGNQVLAEQLWTPAILANSPYGGMVYDNGTIPPDIPGAPGYPTAWSSLGAPASNGTAAGAFFITNVSIYATKNVTEWGPGSNDRCSQPYLTEFLPLSGGGGGGTAFVPISTPSNLSDRGEATNATYGTPPFVFQNGFTAANSPNFSTCGGATQALLVSAPLFTAWAPTLLGGTHTLIPVVLPFAVSFKYEFPANFGTWAVDNLSAPGGPGGGWAFDYLGPCL